MNLYDLGDAKYIALETFRKNGEGVITPVWVAQGNGKLYVWTQSKSWKVKRIRNNNRVRVCKSNGRGNPKSDWIEARATILDDREDESALFQLMSSKYGFQFRIFSSIGSVEDRVFIEIS
jgi:PPOX class probable F420-dependent enzyme